MCEECEKRQQQINALRWELELYICTCLPLEDEYAKNCRRD